MEREKEREREREGGGGGGGSVVRLRGEEGGKHVEHVPHGCVSQ